MSFVRSFLVYLFLCIFCFLMLRIIIGYSSFDTSVQFLARKQEYIHDKLWLTAFYIHSFSAVICLFAGFTQFSTDFLKDNKKLHRLFGKIYVFNILFINFPTGMVLAVNANGLLVSRIEFILLDLLWFYFTLRAYQLARSGEFAAHRNFMIRSYALTLSAITLRSWKMILVDTINIDPLHLYMIISWLGFVPNLLLAEIIIRRKLPSEPSETRTKQQNNDKVNGR